VKQIYENNGIKYTRSLVETATEKTSQNLSIFLIFQSIFQATITFALIISVIGLITSMVSSVKSRTTEIGTLRSMGASKLQITNMIFGETIAISTIGLILGIISGILCINSIIPHISFNPYIPMVPSIPFDYILTITFGTFIIASLAAIIPAYLTTKVDIIEAISLRE